VSELLTGSIGRGTRIYIPTEHAPVVNSFTNEEIEHTLPRVEPTVLTSTLQQHSNLPKNRTKYENSTLIYYSDTSRLMMWEIIEYSTKSPDPDLSSRPTPITSGTERTSPLHEVGCGKMWGSQCQRLKAGLVFWR